LKEFWGRNGNNVKSPFLPLHQSQRDRIISETGFAVYDDFPGKDVAMPYIVMGEVSGRDWSDKFAAGQEVTSTLHIWSDYPGRKECAEMQDAILRALSGDALSLGQEFRAVYSGLDMTQILIDLDGVTRHGVLRIRYLIEEV
jgi:hypothetical protein